MWWSHAGLMMAHLCPGEPTVQNALHDASAKNIVKEYGAEIGKHFPFILLALLLAVLKGVHLLGPRPKKQWPLLSACWLLEVKNPLLIYNSQWTQQPLKNG